MIASYILDIVCITDYTLGPLSHLGPPFHHSIRIRHQRYPGTGSRTYTWSFYYKTYELFQHIQMIFTYRLPARLGDRGLFTLQACIGFFKLTSVPAGLLFEASPAVGPVIVKVRVPCHPVIAPGAVVNPGTLQTINTSVMDTVIVGHHVRGHTVAVGAYPVIIVARICHIRFNHSLTY